MYCFLLKNQNIKSTGGNGISFWAAFDERGEGDDCRLPHHVPALDCHHSGLQFQRSKGHKQRQSFRQHPAPSPCSKYHLYFAQGNSPTSSKKGPSQGSRSVRWFAPLPSSQRGPARPREGSAPQGAWKRSEPWAWATAGATGYHAAISQVTWGAGYDQSPGPFPTSSVGAQRH